MFEILKTGNAALRHQNLLKYVIKNGSRKQPGAISCVIYPHVSLVEFSTFFKD